MTPTLCGLNAEEILTLKGDKRRMAAELIELKLLNSRQELFIDTLENTLAEHGFLVIDTLDENLKDEVRRALKSVGVSL